MRGSGGAFFPYLNNTIFDSYKYGVFELVCRNNYKHNCLYLASKAGGLSDIKLQQLILTLRNRTIHKCDLENVCNVLEIHIELISLSSNGGNRVEHYGTYFGEKCNLGLAKGHYFINDYTELTSYRLEHHGEVKDIKGCNNIVKEVGGTFRIENGRFIKAFQMFKILMNSAGSLITPMPSSEEVMTTQFYDKVGDCETLEYRQILQTRRLFRKA